MAEAPGGIDLPPDVVKRLLGFLCAVAWADRAIQPQERAYFQRLMERFQMSDVDARQLIMDLQRPPSVEALDLDSIPEEHRRRFLREAERVANADGRVTAEEKLVLKTLRQRILGGR